MKFDFEVPVTFFEKAGAEPAKMRRIGGIISTENPDRQNEVILSRGLDLDPFLSAGWFNDNHSKETTDILGYPESVQAFQKGDLLPDGTSAPVSGVWAEGYLLNTSKADRIWELGNALQGTGRHLGFSVEGSIQKRTGARKKTIAKAVVRNVAITNCPVNGDSRLDILSKSLAAVEQSAPDPMEKALGMGTAPTSQPAGPQSGIGAGQVLAMESLEQDGQARLKFEDKDKKDEDKVKKSLSDLEALAFVLETKPGISLSDAGRIIDLTKALKRRGRL